MAYADLAGSSHREGEETTAARGEPRRPRRGSLTGLPDPSGCQARVGSITPKRVTQDGLGVQGADPSTWAAYPGGRIRCIHRHFLSLDRQILVHGIQEKDPEAAIRLSDDEDPLR